MKQERTNRLCPKYYLIQPMYAWLYLACSYSIADLGPQQYGITEGNGMNHVRGKKLILLCKSSIIKSSNKPTFCFSTRQNTDLNNSLTCRGVIPLSKKFNGEIHTSIYTQLANTSLFKRKVTCYS